MKKANTTLQGLNRRMGPTESGPSDTQPVSQTAFKDIIHQNNQDSLRTLHDGETGHVDLLAGLNSQFNTANNEVLEEEEEDDEEDRDPSSPPAMFQPNLFPESQRFVPKTPVSALRKDQGDDRNNESPCFSWNPLASQARSNGGTMELSQVFQGTQVASSPVANRLYSDQMSDRPSPNLPIQRFPTYTALSSPNLAFPQNSSEPNMNYITLKQSQEKRMTRSAEHVYTDDQSEDESQEPSYVERLKRRKRIDEESAAQFATLSAPARPDSKHLCQDNHELLSEQSDAADERQGPGILQNETLSEEETEQEDDDDEKPRQPAPRTQVPNSSTEEDKENSAQVFAAATNTHDRLSQALSRASPSSDGGAQQPHQPLNSPKPDEDVIVDGVGQSSQTYIVKDSQQSPTRNGDRRERQLHGDTSQPRDRSGNPLSQREDRQEMEETSMSPSKTPIRSSPPRSLSQSNRNQSSLPAKDGQAITRTHSASVSSNESSSELPKGSSAPDAARTVPSNPASQPAKLIGEKSSLANARDTSSSLPSHVIETPIHQQHKNVDVVPGTTIPETSPNRIPVQVSNNEANGDTIAQEDDDLPLIRPTEQDRATQLRPSLALSSKILSSPSGRQRRPLTEIAADDPPPETNNIEPFLNILTDDDNEYRSMISDSPNPPRKKRRMNIGQRQGTHAPGLVRPATPSRSIHPQAQEPVPDAQQERPDAVVSGSARSATPPISNHAQQKQPTVEIPLLNPQPNETVTTLRSRPRTSVWDVDASPQRPAARSRSRKSDSREQRPQSQGSNDRYLAPQKAHHISRRNSRGSNKSAELNSEESTATTTQPQPTTTARPVSPGGVQIAPNQILAPWSGQKRAYYPATCLGIPSSSSAERYIVQFEDSDPIEVPISTVKKLELRIGDAVKVDMPAVPRVAHIIRGFDDKINEEDLKKPTSSGLAPITDIYGFSSVIVGPKQRKSLPNGGLSGPESTVKVPIARIYLDTILWNQMKDRSFDFDEGTQASGVKLQTPDRHSTPGTPSTRLSRSIRFMGGIFSGMIFAVSYADEKDKTHFTQLIKGNGGHITEGFNDFLEIPSSVPLATPSKPSQAASSNQSIPNLRLANGAEEVGFACVVADKHSRRVKYMQALALNIPCLSGRWVEDCIAQNRIVDWDLYLLPAGESTYLNGATKSRILPPTPAANARFSQTIASRPNLLRDQSVLMVMNRGKEEETSKAYVFLTYALGAARVERVYDLKSAKSLLQEESKARLGCSWNWIYVHGYDPDTIKKAFLGSGASGSQTGSRKRKLSHAMSCINGQELGLSPKLTVVGNDFVCQSLILGRLFEA